MTHLRVIDYARARTTDLQPVLDDEPDMVFEAHSTDDRRSRAYGAGAGPLGGPHSGARPGIRAARGDVSLAAIEAEVVAEAQRLDLTDVIEARMLAQPAHWEGYYKGNARQQHLARLYSYSDRLAYYRPDPEVHEAQEPLLDNLSATDIPLPLLSQYMPDQYARVRDGELSAHPRALVIDGVRDVLRAYAPASKETSS